MDYVADAVFKGKLNKPICPVCGSKVIGIFYRTCTNPECKNYSGFAFTKCQICGRPHWDCAC